MEAIPTNQDLGTTQGFVSKFLTGTSRPPYSFVIERGEQRHTNPPMLSIFQFFFPSIRQNLRPCPQLQLSCIFPPAVFKMVVFSFPSQFLGWVGYSFVQTLKVCTALKATGFESFCLKLVLQFGRYGLPRGIVCAHGLELLILEWCGK